ncbi:MAG TPA: crossover junction endodeoxyribonuclease RuvC [Coprothermobacter sp.]|nr:crossover junction endodeoxyribonuclease RuvC [Coprothermobacter sp.]
MVVFGVDPGSTRVGLALLDDESRSWLHVQCLELTGLHEDVRYTTIERYVGALCDVFQPKEMAIEKLIWGKNRNNLLQISECRGVVKLVAYKRAIKVFEYFPTEVKSLTTGYGHEGKEGIVRTLGAETGLSILPLFDDTSDAMAVAWVHSLMRHSRVIES